MPDFDDEVREVRRMSAVAVEHVGPWTVDEFFELDLPTGQRHELIDGNLLVSPAPGYAHQRASSWLWLAFQSVAPPQFEAYEAVNVRAGNSRLFIPDVAIIRCPGTTAKVLPASDVVLVAEIVSPSSVAIDRTLKMALYASAGIPHYLLVELDGADGPSIVAYTLAGEAYQETGSARAGEVLTLYQPYPVELDPATLVHRT